jgi:hypothetical protein
MPDMPTPSVENTEGKPRNPDIPSQDRYAGKGKEHTLSKPCSRLKILPSTSSLFRLPPALYILTAWKL